MAAMMGVDVVVVARNEARDVGACLESLVGQEFAGELRLWLVDHGSRDGTAELGRGWGVEVLECGGSLGAARNRGWRAGLHPLVAFVDAHCVLEPGWLTALVQRLEETGAGGVEGHLDYRFGYAAAQPGVRQGSAYPWLKTGNCLYRRRALEQVGGFGEQLYSCEDVDLAWRVLLAGFPLAYAPRARGLHLDRGNRFGHLLRFFRHGLGAGQLARRFCLSIGPRPRDLRLDGWLYWLGSLWGRWRALPLQAVTAPALVWDCGWGPGERVLWWYDQEGLVVLARGERRCRLEGTATLFWRCLSLGWSCQRLVQRVARASACPAERVAGDVEAWLAELLAEGWLRARPESRREPG